MGLKVIRRERVRGARICLIGGKEENGTTGGWAGTLCLWRSLPCNQLLPLSTSIRVRIWVLSWCLTVPWTASWRAPQKSFESMAPESWGEPRDSNTASGLGTDLVAKHPLRPPSATSGTPAEWCYQGWGMDSHLLETGASATFETVTCAEA